jgi:hypothetical protein
MVRESGPGALPVCTFRPSSAPFPRPAARAIAAQDQRGEVECCVTWGLSLTGLNEERERK